MTVRTTSWLATTGRRWRRCFSTSPAAAFRKVRHEPARQAPRDLAASDQRDDLALLVSADVLVAAPAGTDLLARAGGALSGAVILWYIPFRGQLGFSISFLEEMWARNLGNLMMSPLKPIEFLISLMIMSLIRLAIGVIPMTLLAMILFDFNFYGIGLPLVAFFCNLIFTSWSLGIFVSGLVLRNGLGAESIVWTLMFGVMPLACIYYPVTVLPHWLQYVAWTLPPTYVFEGMRALLMDHMFRADLMIQALLINVVLFIASFAIFLVLLRSARRHGSLIQGGE